MRQTCAHCPPVITAEHSLCMPSSGSLLSAGCVAATPTALPLLQAAHPLLLPAMQRALVQGMASLSPGPSTPSRQDQVRCGPHPRPAMSRQKRQPHCTCLWWRRTDGACSDAHACRGSVH
jgi:hypothetical protein